MIASAEMGTACISHSFLDFFLRISHLVVSQNVSVNCYRVCSLLGCGKAFLNLLLNDCVAISDIVQNAVIERLQIVFTLGTLILL